MIVLRKERDRQTDTHLLLQIKKTIFKQTREREQKENKKINTAEEGEKNATKKFRKHDYHNYNK